MVYFDNAKCVEEPGHMVYAMRGEGVDSTLIRASDINCEIKHTQRSCEPKSGTF